MSGSTTDQTLALAGVFQAAHLVQQIANLGRANEPALESSLESIFKFEAASTEEVFGGIPGVIDGLRILIAQLGGGQGQAERDLELTRYSVALLHLQRKLLRDRRMTEQIRAGIEATREQIDFFALTHSNTVARLADLYQQTISTLQPRIMVTGEQNHLRNPDNANRIRAVLLAGIRAAVLWGQLGGSRLKLVFGRRRFVAEAQRLLAKI
jgi:high frequency lysogenization protein